MLTVNLSRVTVFARILQLVALSFFSFNCFAKDNFIIDQQEAFVLHNVNLVDGTGSEVQKNKAIFVKSGKIVAIENASEEVSADYVVHDFSGYTLTPGFVMMHEHMFYPTGKANYTEMVYSFPKLYLAGGATTIRTAGTTEPYADLNLNQAIQAGKTIGPDIDVTAPYLNGPGLPIKKIKALENADDAERMVNYWSAEGASSYKVYMHIRKSELSRVNKLAHQNNQKVTGHICSITFEEAADLGIDNIEHGFVEASDFVFNKKENECPSGKLQTESILALDNDDEKIKKLIKHLVKNNVAITSTLTVFETFAKSRPIAPKQALDVLTTDIKHEYLGHWSRIQESDSDVWLKLLKKEMAWEKLFVEMGGHLMVGTDPTGYGGVIAGFSNIRAIQLLTEAGFTFEQAIKIATTNGAEYLGKADTIGSIAVGKRADFVLVNGLPHINVADLNKIERVYKAGIGYDSQTIFNAMKNTVGLH
ncbi:amidohydrolase family protein [Thalassotalea sp. M1531]|uniref:Amidohydrolase family protein n=1 Tax=Thalassotalea algicola TaxID=2716224 RepID=A0A7Y0Q685_9GAMM|nr:amidohydrolase family protein [Thalassotalea algicola]NMP30921.1 amidohydrolase family protein [Thalassotalea algicola]